MGLKVSGIPCPAGHACMPGRRAKRHMRKFNGVPKQHFGLYLKECEWRFNNSDPSIQLIQIRQWVKTYLNQLSRTAPK